VIVLAFQFYVNIPAAIIRQKSRTWHLADNGLEEDRATAALKKGKRLSQARFTL
jgi:hypothetical protein